MAAFFGDLERLIADLYPYRWPITAVVLIVLAALAAFGYRKGWHMVAWQKRLSVAIIGTPLLILAVIAGWYLGSPLFIDERVDEEFPFALNAVVPSGMTRAEVEQVMAGMAKFDLEISEPMSDAMPMVTMDDAVVEAGMAMVKGGMAMVEKGLETSDDSLADEGMAMIQQGAAMSGDVVMAEESVALTQEGIEKSDQAMISKGMAMMQEALDDSVEIMMEQPSAVKLKIGNLRDADKFHKGSGQATIYRGPDGSHLLRLENLDVTNGPALHVILTTHKNPQNRSDVKTSGYIDLGKLKGNQGNQNYPIPDDVDIASLGSVVIYCKPVKVIFSVAPLQDAG